MSEYEETLNKWAEQYAHDGEKVVRVAIEMDEGYRYSSYTFEDPHLEVNIWIQGSNGISFPRSGDVDNLGELLTQLFQIVGAV